MYKIFSTIFIILMACCVNLKVFATESSPFLFTGEESTETAQGEEVIADFQNKTIRVLLSGYNSFAQFAVSVSSRDEIFVTCNDKTILTSKSPIKFNTEGEYLVIQNSGVLKKILLNNKVTIATGNAPITLDNITKAGNPASYNGKLEISVGKNKKLRIINVLDIEDYIKGVVPNEMPVFFGLEALKAQAVSARGYAYRDASLKAEDYDVCDTTGSQVYNGYGSYDPVANKAVEETRGQFALYDGKVILSLYSSTAGGYTENYENVFSKNATDIKFPADPIPYLKGVPDYDYELDLTKEENVKHFLETKPASFELKSPKYRWEYIWSIEELEDILAKNIIKYSSTPFVTPKIKTKEEFGKVISIDVPKRGVSGKAMYVRIVTDQNTFLIAKEIMVRQIFQYDRKWLPSANIVFENIYDIRNNLMGIKVIGGGFGHGVGLSQYGAAGMASKGYSYEQILKHYYTGISIGSYPVECNLNNPQNCKSTFYSKNKNAKLIVSYSHKPNELIFRINDDTVHILTEDFDKKGGQTDISKWMKKGINTIELKPDKNTKKFSSDNTIKFYVELE